MDSLTQITLGAAIGVATMRRSQPIWKSALVGAVIGTLPDLDSFVDFGDDVMNMVRHRGESHSLIYQTLAAPVIAIVIALITRTSGLFYRWVLAAWLILVTHAGLDAMTVYGTQLLLPYTDHPFGVGSIFIIDPLYTLPLLIGLLATLASRGSRRLRFTTYGLVLSSAYLAWSFAAQQYVVHQVLASPALQGLSRDRLLVTPTPFNTVLWRVIAMREGVYQEAYVSLADRFVDPPVPLKLRDLPRGAALEAETRAFDAANRIRNFSHGFYALEERDGRVRITDLRMGLYPWYVFSFDFAQRRAGRLEPVVPFNVGDGRRGPVGDVLNWIWQRAQGRDLPPPR